MFTPIRTKRLLIRPVEPGDAASLHTRRNDPEVARLQAWEVPYTMEQATKSIADVAAMGGPQHEEWWMATVVEVTSGGIVGDLVVHLTWEGRTAEIGYTLAREFWGKGYAVEAVDALLDWLFDDMKITRATGTLHPDNRASAMVLERTGFLFEGHTKSSYWLGDEVSDDWIYGLVAEDRRAWKDRPRGRPSSLSLVPILTGTEHHFYRLKTHKTQEEFVAPMPVSFTDALFPEIVDGAPVQPWLRGVVADDAYVGFVMLALTTEHHPEPFLWRLLLDRMHQRRGIGGMILDLVVEECLAMGDKTLVTSWVEGKGSPAPFYLSHGFVPTGQILDDETEARKQLV